MLDEPLQEQAALYAAGVMPQPEREHFELVLKFHTELRTLVAELEEITVAATLAALPATTPRPSASLRARILAQLDDRVQATSEEGFVVTSAEGFVEWVNPAFIAMCGYELSELRGKKLGPILQGAATDLSTAERMRRAVHEHRPCSETILNYHKNGQPYWVEVSITPILDEAGATRWFVAQEREIPDSERAAA